MATEEGLQTTANEWLEFACKEGYLTAPDQKHETASCITTKNEII